MTTSRKQLERRPLFAGHRPERGLHGEIDRHGNEVWYYRAGHGPRTRIEGDFGSPKFIEAYKTAKWGRPSAAVGSPAQKGLSRQDPNSLEWLIERYLASHYFASENEPATQKQHRSILRGVAKRNGDKPYRMLDWSNIKALRDHIAANGFDPERPGPAPSMANRVVSVIRTLFDWAIKQERLLEMNPCLGVDKVSYKQESHHKWTDAECATFGRAYPLGKRERLMYELLQTGQRCSDVVRMGPKHIDRDGDGMTIVQQKTGKEVTVPMLRHLKEALAAGPCGKETFIASEHDGSPISEGHFGNLMRAACDKIGVAECTAHGLRHAAATRALENGADADYLMAVFGFTLPIAAKYVAKFEGKRSAKRGAHFLERKAPSLKLVA